MVSYDEYIDRVKKYYRQGKYYDTKHTTKIRNPIKKKNLFIDKEGKVLVSKVKTSKQLKTSVKKSIDLIGGLKKGGFKKSDSVLIVANFNSDDLFPATTDIKYVEAVIKILKDYGIKKITIGNCSGVHWLPTRAVMGKLGILALADKLKVNIACFEEEDWIKIKLNSKTLRDLSFARAIFKHDKLIYLPCMKTHRRARFTMSLKLTMGLLCIKHRVLYMHTKGIEEKVADLNKAVYPDLILMDARKIFITGGPDKGTVRSPGLIFASGDRVAIDMVGLDYLLKYKNEDNLLYPDKKAEEYGQIKRGMKIGLGIKSRDDVRIV
ncbi:DUF362 domain-containing protein [Nanoarchaeota archaeon]